MISDLESFWAEILSKDPDRIQSAFMTLSTEEQYALLDHLRDMANEPGWSDGQRERAKAALQVIESK